MKTEIRIDKIEAFIPLARAVRVSGACVDAQTELFEIALCMRLDSYQVALEIQRAIDACED